MIKSVPEKFAVRACNLYDMAKKMHLRCNNSMNEFNKFPQKGIGSIYEVSHHSLQGDDNNS
ncbi:hypothetical protein C1N59_18200 [Pantoea sp. SGAir0183]